MVRKFKRDGSYWGEHNLDDERDGRIVCLRPDKISFRHYKKGVQHGRNLTIRKNNGVINIQDVQNGVLKNSHISIYQEGSAKKIEYREFQKHGTSLHIRYDGKIECWRKYKLNMLVKKLVKESE